MPADRRTSARGTKRAGVRDVAEIAGVAPITVSRALRLPDTVAPETRQRIADAISTLGYIPNRVAGSLSSNHTRLIGAIIPSFQSSASTEFTGGMANVLRTRGYQLLLGSSNFSIDEEEALVMEFLSHRADGIYLTGTTHTERTRRLLKDSGIPVVEIASLSGGHIDIAVGFSNADASFEMTKYLAGVGYRKIAFFSMPTRDNERQAERLSGFRRGVAEFGLDVDGALVDEVAMDLSSAANALNSLLGRRPDVEAVFCTSDLLAAGTLFECQRIGIQVPQQLAIAGFDDIELAARVQPPLTTVRLPHQSIGARAAELLLDRIAGQPIETPVVDLGFEIVVRESTGTVTQSAARP
jgi:LacI family transcriptional regulator, gluconate utilization system Gnt-I transcriptional repressor